MAFGRLRYPIQGAFSEDALSNGHRRGLSHWLTSGLRRSGHSVFENGVFTACDPLLVTPRDFDLSPYFEVVKFSRREFDYKKIKWAAAGVAVELAPHAEPVAAPALAASKAVG